MIEKIVTISGIECKLKASAALPRLYRAKFRRDIFVDMNKLKKEMDKNKETGDDFSINSLEMFENIAYLMHKYGDPSQPNKIEDWLDQFHVFDIYEVLPEIVDMWGQNTERMSEEVKKDEAPTVK